MNVSREPSERLSGSEIHGVCDEAYHRWRRGAVGPTKTERMSPEYGALCEEINRYVADGTTTERTWSYTSITYGPARSTQPSKRAQEVIKSTIGPAVTYTSDGGGQEADVRAVPRSKALITAASGSGLYYDHERRVERSALAASYATQADHWLTAMNWAEKHVGEREAWEAEHGFDTLYHTGTNNHGSGTGFGTSPSTSTGADQQPSGGGDPSQTAYGSGYTYSGADQTGYSYETSQGAGPSGYPPDPPPPYSER
ncbi:hypothetical protein IAU59_003923 [Kwoniella sp. CBS 9459]